MQKRERAGREGGREGGRKGRREGRREGGREGRTGRVGYLHVHEHTLTHVKFYLHSARKVREHTYTYMYMSSQSAQQHTVW